MMSDKLERMEKPFVTMRKISRLCRDGLEITAEDDSIKKWKNKEL
jgi:hypothetical protein